MLLNQRTTGFGQLRRDRDERHAMFLQGAHYLLQSIQLCDAIGSPAAAENCQDQWPLRQQVGRMHFLAKRVCQSKRGKRVAHFDNPIHDVRCAQISGCAVHDRTFVGRDAFVGALPDGFESFGQHYGSSMVRNPAIGGLHAHNTLSAFFEGQSAA